MWTGVFGTDVLVVTDDLRQIQNIGILKFPRTVSVIARSGSLCAVVVGEYFAFGSTSLLARTSPGSYAAFRLHCSNYGRVRPQKSATLGQPAQPTENVEEPKFLHIPHLCGIFEGGDVVFDIRKSVAGPESKGFGLRRGYGPSVDVYGLV